MLCYINHETSATPEPLFYHNPSRYGTVAFFQKLDEDKRKQRTVKLSDITTAIHEYFGQEDVYIVQNEFNAFNRRLINLERLTLAFSDLDTYKSKYAGQPPEVIAKALDEHLKILNLPTPSIIMFSGRGLQVKWTFEAPKSPKHLPLWSALQHAISYALLPFGSDQNALDASRVLRLEGSIHSKTKAWVRHVFPDRPNTLYSFSELCRAFGANDWLDVKATKKGAKTSKKSKRAKESAIIPGNPFRVIEGGRNNNPDGHKSNFIPKTKHSLAWSRLLDLRTLADLRGGVQEGQRMLFLFWSLNFMGMSFQVNSMNFWDEARGVAERFFPNGDWDEAALGTVFEKVCQHCRGEKVEFNGETYTPLYTPRNSTLIRAFNITPEEQMHMITIIDPVERARRSKERMEWVRRFRGMKNYEESEAKKKPWAELGISRATYYRRKNKENIDAVQPALKLVLG